MFVALDGLKNVFQESTNLPVENMILIVTGCVQVTKWLSKINNKKTRSGCRNLNAETKSYLLKNIIQDNKIN